MKHTNVIPKTDWNVLQYHYLDYHIHDTYPNKSLKHSPEYADLLATKDTQIQKNSINRKGA